MIRYATLVLAVIVGLGLTDVAVAAPLSDEQQHLSQQKEFAADRAMVFSSVLDVFQDMGYAITTAESTAGLITAESPMTDSNKGAGDLSLGDSAGNNRITVAVEEYSQGLVRVRLNIIYRKRLPRSPINKGRFEEPVTDPGIYSDVFRRIDAAISRRRLSVSAPPEVAPR